MVGLLEIAEKAGYEDSCKAISAGMDLGKNYGVSIGEDNNERVCEHYNVTVYVSRGIAKHLYQNHCSVQLTLSSFEGHTEVNENVKWRIFKIRSNLRRKTISA